MNPTDPMLLLHVLSGSAGFLLGAGALLLPKFGPRAALHRSVGRAYAAAMLLMSVLSIPLALRQGDALLLVIGVVTLGWVAGGVQAIRARRGHPDRARAGALLSRHVLFMGSSYIGAWTAFLVNVEPLGEGGALFWLYALGPTVIGSVLIARRLRGLSTQPTAIPPTDAG